MYIKTDKWTNIKWWDITIDDKKKEIWVYNIKADGGVYKGCPKNDYCKHFVDLGERPQNFIWDYEEDWRFLDYPKLNELIKRKNEVLQKRATPTQWLKCDLKTLDLSTMGKFDVILIDPPLPEYARQQRDLELIPPDLSPGLLKKSVTLESISYLMLVAFCFFGWGLLKALIKAANC